MRQDSRTLKELELLLKQEIQLYEDYLATLIEEEKWVTRFKQDKIQALTISRAKLCEQMLAAQDQRLRIMRTFPVNEGMRLRDLVIKFYPPREAKRVLPLIDRLRLSLIHI